MSPWVQREKMSNGYVKFLENLTANSYYLIGAETHDQKNVL